MIFMIVFPLQKTPLLNLESTVYLEQYAKTQTKLFGKWKKKLNSVNIFFNIFNKIFH